MSSAIHIHGVGVVGAFGCGLHALSDATRPGSPEVKPALIEESPAAGVPFYPADASPLREQLSPRSLRRADLFARLIVLGSLEALHDADALAVDRDRIGLIVASGHGANVTMFRFLYTCLDNGDAGASPSLFSRSGHGSGLSNATILLGLTGPGLTLCQPDLAWTTALLAARDWLGADRADVVLVCAVEECYPLLRYVHARRHGDRISGPIRPFDFDAQSAILGEGCACIALRREGTSPGTSLGRIDGIEQPHSTGGIDPADAEVLLLGADGQRETGRHYAELPRTIARRSFAAAFGSMPTGLGFSLAAQLASHRTGGRVDPRFESGAAGPGRMPRRLCCVETSAAGQAGVVRVRLQSPLPIL